MEATGNGPQSTDPPAPAPERREGEQLYVVQRPSADAASQSLGVLWEDVATVSVAPRTKRRTIIQKALEVQPGAAPDKKSRDEVPFRVLDAESSAEIPVRWEAPPAPEPELRIG